EVVGSVWSDGEWLGKQGRGVTGHGGKLGYRNNTLNHGEDRGEFTLSSLNVLQGFSFFLQMGLTLILATLDGLDVGLLGEVIGEDDYDDDG
nr:hypothetical protein [Tanacetum cinerariifolium]